MSPSRMHIEACDLRTRHVFGLSRGAEQVFHNLVVRIRHDGLEGLGEAAPSAYYGERAETARASLPLYWEVARERVEEILAEPHPFGALEALQCDWEGVLRHNGAARGALDMALWDLWGRRHGVSAGAEIRAAAGVPDGPGGSASLNCPATSYTIAIDAPETLDARLQAAEGYRVLKVKLGGPDDLGTLRRVRAATDRPIRVDANCAWRGAEAVERLKPLVALGLEMIEQPCPPKDLDTLARVREAFGVPVYADESAETLDDLDSVAGRVDGINVKLVKCGGPTRMLQYVRRARDRGLEVMLGCMIETSVCITAAAHLAPLADRLDLDGALLLDRDPYRGVEWAGGCPRVPGGPGLGVTAR
ncbi:MAG: dipeptide epimerase [Candidatus Eisenbacteria bacterium]|nr:dipeptide epimerase [Candidatus Eisenbacteria bacterium]